MLLNLKKVFDITGESVTFADAFDFSAVEYSGRRPFGSEVQVSGRVYNRAGMVLMTYSAEFTLSVLCDRCLEPIDRKVTYEFSHKLAYTLNDDQNDDYILVPEAELDVKELTLADILLEMPIQFLCREDCKGLCDRCGSNLNLGPCGCSRTVSDPRLSALDQWLEE